MSFEKEENLKAKKSKTTKNPNDFFNIESDEEDEENEDEEKKLELEKKTRKWSAIYLISIHLIKFSEFKKKGLG
jgi:hypothetical protein